jgi:uncharacterized protein (DUF1810 family)
MTTPDPYNLDRFVRAQNPVYDEVRAELRRGRKTSHWMWFIFPQVDGLGFSAMTKRYAIGGIAEAEAYLQHAELGPRLIECTQIVLALEGLTARAIFGQPDDLKFRSCMTLFSQVPGSSPVFDAAIQKYSGGAYDTRTLRMLDTPPESRLR